MSDEEEERQPKDYKVFVDSCDSYVGTAVSKYLAKKGFTVFGYGKTSPDSSIHMVKSRKEGILSTELSVFDMTEETKAVEEALEIVNGNPLHKKITLCIFSPLLTWGGRSLKSGTEEEEEKKEKNEEEEEKKEEPEAHEEEDDVETEPFTPVNEEEYLTRIPSELVKEQYRLESRALQLNQEIDRLTVTIFGVGLLYGCGENILFPFFRALWENKMNEFPASKNHISCMHVMNLGIAISQILTSPPDPEERRPYYIIGEENCPSLKAIGKAFSKVLSDGKVKEFNENIPELHKGILTTELAAESTFLGEAEDIHCQEGIIECAAKVVDEFRAKYHLEPLKVLVIGPPGSGYGEVAHRVSDKLGLPFIEPEALVEAAKKETSEFGDEIRNQIEENEGKVSNEIICKVAHKRMAARDCRNYGWVMSGFADTLAKATEIYDVGEEEQPSPHFEHIPTHVIVLEADDKQLEIREAKKSNDMETFKKALKRYRKANGSDENIFNFFDDRAIPSAIVPAFGEIDDEVFKFLGPKRDFGRPQEEIDAEIAEKERVVREAKEKEEADRKEQLENEKEKWTAGEKIHEVAVGRMEHQDNEYLSEKAMVLQQYLDKVVMKHVIAGIVHVAKEMPEDPVDALAEFLFAENRKVRD